MSAQIVVDFPDPNLEALIRDAIAKPTGPIYDTDLAGLTSLTGQSAGISDLTGLEYCSDPITLHLHYNDISDISALAVLTGLWEFDLHNNQISDISALAANTGIANRDQVYLLENPLDCHSILIDIPALLARDVRVSWSHNASCDADTDSDGMPAL